MSELLSQEEMSSLLSIFSDMGAEHNTSKTTATSRRIKSYDFTHPDMLGKNQMSVLHNVHSNYAEKINKAISSAVQVPVTTSLISIDQLSYADYVSSLDQEMISTQVSLSDDAPAGIVDISLPFATACIDALTGGDGISFESVFDLSDIDIAILRKVVSKLTNQYQLVWGIKSSSSDNSHCERRLSSERQEYLPTESVIAICYEVRAGEIAGMMHICLPYSTTQNLLPVEKEPKTLSTTVATSSAKTQQILHESLQEVPIECKAILGRTSLSTKDIIHLQAGDVIRLDEQINSEVEFWVGEKLAYAGTPGQTGSNVGLRITRGLSSASFEKLAPLSPPTSR